uniref:SAM-dependent MTase RsmB/NOP-type domain-containing protein n=1 Tax=Calcidiscus leptoporus TaxID=127549 RepID=A0A7S0P4A9_9EUKA|mmetsp:Transcript_53243/g.122352  ORF Transcript_53243/g.122352 Transcript_53243/m.122352 type:complete len:191 (+) Transcript_53243:1098-1670(+)
MRDTGAVVAVELQQKKLRLIRANSERLRLASVAAHALDATNASALLALLAARAVGCDASQGADVVVLDAPCSGMGTLRRNPEHRYQDCSRLEQLTALQDRLLDAAAQCVRPGGALVYSVCSPLEREGGERVRAFLRRHPAFTCPPVHTTHLEPFAADDAALGGERRVVRSWTHRHRGCDSFFAARVIRDL